MGIILSYFNNKHKCIKCYKKILGCEFNNLCKTCYFNEFNLSYVDSLVEFSYYDDYDIYYGNSGIYYGNSGIESLVPISLEMAILAPELAPELENHLMMSEAALIPILRLD